MCVYLVYRLLHVNLHSAISWLANIISCQTQCQPTAKIIHMAYWQITVRYSYIQFYLHYLDDFIKVMVMSMKFLYGKIVYWKPYGIHLRHLL